MTKNNITLIKATKKSVPSYLEKKHTKEKQKNNKEKQKNNNLSMHKKSEKKMKT